MNAPTRLFLNAPRRAMAARLLACASLGACLAGCVGNPFNEAKVDPTSPVAGEVDRLARANKDYPSFSEIPQVPNDVRPLRLYGQAARQVTQVREQLERETAPETWTLQNTGAFADSARAAAGPELPATAGGDTAAFAEDLRRRATPPPPPVR
jgi:hypothetical protein